MTVKSRVRAAPHAALRMPRCGSAAGRASMLVRVRALGTGMIPIHRPTNVSAEEGAKRHHPYLHQRTAAPALFRATTR